MIIKLTGAFFIIFGCCGIGYLISSLYRRTMQGMLQLISALEFIEYTIQYRQSALEDTFRHLNISSGPIKQFFNVLASELEHQVSPNVEYCVNVALGKVNKIPESVEECILKLGKSLGQFSLQDQVKDLQTIRKECEIYLQQHLRTYDSRIRMCQTLTLCAGAVVVVILL